MRTGLVVVCSLIASSVIGAPSARNGAAVRQASVREAALKDDDKPPLIESGTITKIDLKKKILTVRGYVMALPPDNPPQKSGNTFRNGSLRPDEADFQTTGGGSRAPRGGGGRTPSSGSGGRAGVPVDEIREFNVYVRPETTIQDDKNTLTITDLRIEDYVVIVGAPRGKSINSDASSISVSSR